MNEKIKDIADKLNLNFKQEGNLIIISNFFYKIKLNFYDNKINYTILSYFGLISSIFSGSQLDSFFKELRMDCFEKNVQLIEIKQNSHS